MEKKTPFAQRVEAFFAGKGFYIALFLCVAVIGVSAWSMITGAAKPKSSVAVSGMEDTAEPVIALPKTTGTPAPTPVPSETPAAVPREEPAPVTAPVQEIPAADYFIWPLAGSVETGYCMTELRYDRTMRDWRTHDGLDIAAEPGTQVRAVTGGSVAAVYEDAMYGTTVILSHRDGLTSLYANLAPLPAVKVGDNLAVGAVLGAVGDTALCEVGEVSHLHFSMARDGASVDPGAYLP